MRKEARCSSACGGAARQIEVWDNGIGMGEAEAQRVFDPFYRSATDAQLDSAGRGLGLAVEARSARLMGATHGVQSSVVFDAIWNIKPRLLCHGCVANPRDTTRYRCGLRLAMTQNPSVLFVPSSIEHHTRPGQGSLFWLRQNASTCTSAGATSPPAPVAVGLPPLARGRCLVVDDEPLVLQAWSALFEAWSIEARYADSAAQAHAHLDAGFVPQAIFCDQRLRSGESGRLVLQALLGRCPEASGELHSAELAQV